MGSEDRAEKHRLAQERYAATKRAAGLRQVTVWVPSAAVEKFRKMVSAWVRRNS